MPFPRSTNWPYHFFSREEGTHPRTGVGPVTAYVCARTSYLSPAEADLTALPPRILILILLRTTAGMWHEQVHTILPSNLPDDVSRLWTDVINKVVQPPPSRPPVTGRSSGGFGASVRAPWAEADRIGVTPAPFISFNFHIILIYYLATVEP